MIKLSIIDENLSIYYNKKIIIFGASGSGSKIFKNLKKFDVVAFCDNNASKWGNKKENLPIISPEELKKIYDADSYLIQIASTYEQEIIQQLRDMGIENYICYKETACRLNGIMCRNTLTSDYLLDRYYNSVATYYKELEKSVFNYIIDNKDDDLYFLCLPTKTGDWTLNKSLEGKINFINMWHRPSLFDLKAISLINNRKKIKIITAVRDPIAQNLSTLFQMLSDFPHGFFWDMSEYWENGGDVQKIFDRWLQLEEYISLKNIQESNKNSVYVQTIKAKKLSCMLQRFEDEFCKYIIDLYKYPFNTETGYSIIKVDNIEVFIFQLEKLNVIKSNLFEWLNISKDTELLLDNVGASKWYGNAYRLAQKEIKFSKEYFDKCYNEKYVSHFYSKNDIMMFKKRWEGHIC